MVHLMYLVYLEWPNFCLVLKHPFGLLGILTAREWPSISGVAFVFMYAQIYCSNLSIQHSPSTFQKWANVAHEGCWKQFQKSVGSKSDECTRVYLKPWPTWPKCWYMFAKWEADLAKVGNEESSKFLRPQQSFQNSLRVSLLGICLNIFSASWQN